MELRVDLTSATVEALTYQDALRFDAVYSEPGEADSWLQGSLNGFLSVWLKNLLSQGHAENVSPCTAD